MVTFEHVSKTYGDGTPAVRDLNLTVEKGQFVVLIGPSGCGKTTTLKMVNRLIEPTAGEIYLNGQKTSALNLVEMRRNIGYVIQNIGLLPHLTVAANIALVPELKGWPRRKREERVDELLSLVGMEPALYRQRFPAQLSGGQQQRVGVLRALAADPDLILMDEPFGALDPLTRDQLQLEFKRIKEKLKKTILFVTHDMNEALLLADRIVLMKDGAVVQDDTPERLLRHPADDFVANFVGRAARPQAAGELLVSDVMNPAPVTIEAERGLGEALKRMQKYKVDSLLVVREGHLAGLVQARDLYPHLLKDESVPVGEVAAAVTVTVAPNVPLNQAATKLSAGGLNLVPVVSSDGRLQGVLTRASLVGVLVESWSGNGHLPESREAVAAGGGAQ